MATSRCPNMTSRKPAPSAYMKSFIHQIERDMSERERQLYLALPNKHDHEPYGEDENVAYLEELHRILKTNVMSFWDGRRVRLSRSVSIQPRVRQQRSRDVEREYRTIHGPRAARHQERRGDYGVLLSDLCG
jgi:hypothetical protein